MAVKLHGASSWYWSPHPVGVEICLADEDQAQAIADFVASAANRQLARAAGIEAGDNLDQVENAGIF